MSEAEERNGVQSVEIAGGIMTAMAAAGVPLPLKEIARRTGLSPGKVHRYLVSLVRCELVRQEADTGRYGIGPAAIAVGLSGLRSINVVRTAADRLPQIRDAINETAVLAIWSREGPVIVHLEESSRQIYMNVRVGSILPLLRSAVGRVYAAFLPPTMLDPMLAAEMASAHALEQGDAQAMLAETRRRGVGMVAGDLVPGVSALAAPVLDHRGQIAACVGVLGRTEELDTAAGGAAVASIKSHALSISYQIGFNPDAPGGQPWADIDP